MTITLNSMYSSKNLSNLWMSLNPSRITIPLKVQPKEIFSLKVHISILRNLPPNKAYSTRTPTQTAIAITISSSIDPKSLAKTPKTHKTTDLALSYTQIASTNPTTKVKSQPLIPPTITISNPTTAQQSSILTKIPTRTSIKPTTPNLSHNPATRALFLP